MKILRIIVPVLLGSALLASTAQAADVVRVIPAPPPPVVVQPAPEAPWQGPYVGLIGGYAWAYKNWFSLQFVDSETSHRAAGFLLGIEGGYRWQNNNMVYGVEADWAWTNANGASTCPNDPFFGDSCRTRIHWLATLTGQVGFTFGNLMAYGEAGLVIARETINADGPPQLTDFEATFVNGGWTIGGGVAARIGDGGLYIKAEYNYANFGTDEVVLRDPGGLEDPIELTQHAHIFKLGVGFQF